MSSKKPYHGGPPSSPTFRMRSLRGPRSFSSLIIGVCAVTFLVYAFRSYTTPEFEIESIHYPQRPIHSGLSDPPPGLYKGRPDNPFSASRPQNDGLHHSLSEEGKDKPENDHDKPETDDDGNPIVEIKAEEPKKPEERPKEDAQPTKAEQPKQEDQHLNTSEDQKSQASKDSKPAADSKSDLQHGEPYNIIEDTKNGDTGKSPTNPHKLTTTLVVGRTDAGVEGTQWMYDSLDDITTRAVYVVDDPEADLHLDKNKGREAMVYMKYIVEHYDKLSDVSIFFHSSRLAWHNNILLNKDGAVMINNLRRQHVVNEGYFNLRCELHPGCPRWVQWNATREQNRDRHPERYNDLFSAQLWDELFPNRSHDPVWLAEPCCSQYALSRDRIRSRPLADYVRIQDFLAASRIGDGFLGRVMEYVWQFLWLDKDEHCPSMVDCYCKGYGICLSDEDQISLNDWNQAKSDEDEMLTKLGEYDAEHCNKIEDLEEKRECKKENPFNPGLGENRRKAGTIMEQHLKKYIIKDLK